VIVLNFHGVGPLDRELADGEADVCIDRELFAEILDVVAGRTDVRLTFDDGNRSDVAAALPELTRRGLNAEFFICAGRFGTPAFVDESDIRALREAGMGIGSHGMDHVPWRRLDAPAIEREIAAAKRRLEDALGAPVDTAACPFGAYDRRTLQALRSAGFTRVYTSDRGRADAEEWLAPRNTVRRSDTAEAVERLLDGSSAGVTPVDRAKRLLKQWR
jgi:peptidoglycan/xylan/chitin deacetylase (PgdA/CDA1 family)